MRVGFVGAGQLGEPMVVRLLAAGHTVHVFARRQEVASRLHMQGAVVAASLADLGRTCDIVICCMFSDQQLAQVALGPDGIVAHMTPGSTLVSHTTGRVDTLKRIAGSRPGRDVGIVDAPVSGTAAEIAEGRLTILVGGAADAVDRVTPILGSYAESIMQTGRLGSALNVKLINNLLFAANLQLAAEAVRLGTVMEIAPDALLHALTQCSGSSRAVERALSVGGIEAFGEIAKPFLRKDVAVCLESARAQGSDLGLLGEVASGGALDLTPLGGTADTVDSAVP
ncbi:NAD(P)-dependent oxidoreductase [Rhodococcus oxybenzonivorans]|uniref:NAD(P)-dependent oxidoreductase n=1 Tax=Rhodococcus oxybenzonivorans TaxID=1990687 RepID=UPI00295593CB|nr:NAD(P)-dependent oxidoreductase [Rhodococcus oxybenzonivorans]MDV7352781.1 NAD(P)-dependent oxidoreductase [Rhodococcus oxybenzonivorans]